MTADTQTVDLDEMHAREWMAARIGKSTDWIEHHMRHVPHIRVGRTPFFTERLAREYLEAQTVRPVSGQTSRSRGARRAR